MNWALITVCSIAAFALIAVGMYPLLRVLQKKAILDHPNERSSHLLPTPKGAGLLLIPVVAIFWTVPVFFSRGDSLTPGVLGIAALSVFLCGFSWIDDLRGLPALTRLVVHGLCAGVGLWLMPAEMQVFQGTVPPFLDHILTAILWVWFINLFNFMDGIDGISGIQALGICSGVAGVLVLSNSSTSDFYFAVTLGAGAFGFLIWNWHPARIFLGDAGSAPLGFMLGWLLIRLAGAGEWEAALILPLYYMADTSITLLRRLSRGERVWQAHRQHFYQQAIQKGRSHASVALAVIGVNICLIVCALIASLYLPIVGMFCAVLLVACFLWYLAHFRKRQGHVI